MMTTPSMTVESQGMTPEVRRGVIRWLVREIFGVILVGALLFWPAGTLGWGWGWALVALFGVWVAANAALLIPTHPDLLAERAVRRPGIKSWDSALMGVVGVLTLATYVLAGFDHAGGWSPALPWWAHGVALVVAAGGYALVTWSMVANAYFSMMARIQEDRGQTVQTGGPYRFVRHPGYLGGLLFPLAAPILLGSLWALIPGGLIAALFVLRTALEDRMLQAELPGYVEYTRQTRCRLIPGLW